MGASQSIDTATNEQRAQVGLFYLRSSEKVALNALSDIITLLLTKNNLFDLDGNLNKEKIEYFIDKYNENITERTRR